MVQVLQWFTHAYQMLSIGEKYNASVLTSLRMFRKKRKASSTPKA